MVFVAAHPAASEVLFNSHEMLVPVLFGLTTSL